MQNARERLVHHVQELERLEEEKSAAAEALRDAFKAARDAGYDVATLKVVLRLRKMTPAERKEKRALEAIYMAALGMLEGDPLPEEARRRLDEDRPAEPPAEQAPAAPTKPAPKPEQPPQQQSMLPKKDPAEAHEEGAAAAAEGKRIYDNPYPAGDPCRAAWDEGWCAQNRSHGMETPAAYQRRKKPPEKPPDDDVDGGDEPPSDEKGAA